MKVTQVKARALGKYFKIDYKKTPFREWWIGLNIEMEHSNIVNGNFHTLARIAMAHIEENPRYYYFLQKAGL
jgi:dolichyl-phosphate-mannose--protein O-mannosyl transferase